MYPVAYPLHGPGSIPSPGRVFHGIFCCMADHSLYTCPEPAGQRIVQSQPAGQRMVQSPLYGAIQPVDIVSNHGQTYATKLLTDSAIMKHTVTVEFYTSSYRKLPLQGRMRQTW